MTVFWKVWLSIYNWWIAEVKSLVLIAGSKKKSPNNPENSIIIRKTGYTVCASEAANIETASLENLALELDKVPHLKKQLFVLALDETKYLYRQLSNHLLPDYRVSELAELDLISQTPFERSDVYLIADNCNGSGRGYYILKKSILHSLIDSCKKSKIKTKTLLLTGNDNQFSIKISEVYKFVSESVFRRNLKIAFAFLIIMTSCLTVVHFHWRYEKAGNSLDEQIVIVSKDVAQVRSIVANQKALSNRLKNVLDLKKNASSTMEVWEELSRILPDSSWLSVLKVSDDEIIISGFSRAAASLIEIIDSSPIFAQAGFDGPVVAIAGKNIQRFAIRAKVEK